MSEPSRAHTGSAARLAGFSTTIRPARLFVPLLLLALLVVACRPSPLPETIGRPDSTESTTGPVGGATTGSTDQQSNLAPTASVLWELLHRTQEPATNGQSLARLSILSRLGRAGGIPEGATSTQSERADERIRPSARGSQRADLGFPLPPGLSPDRAKFLSAAIGPAQASARETGVPASVTLAQAILESDWGLSRLAQDAQNYFGIKALRRPGTAGVIRLSTWEHLTGADVIVEDAFRAYHTMEESFVDHGRYFHENNRYARALAAAGDPREFARRIHQAGYATDPDYAGKLIRMMDKFNFYRYDVPVGGQGSGAGDQETGFQP